MEPKKQPQTLVEIERWDLPSDSSNLSVLPPFLQKNPSNASSYWQDEITVQKDILSSNKNALIPQHFIKAGPRKVLRKNPDETVACILTCGGLCPGLNTCVYNIYHTLKHFYKVKTVYGVTHGYLGLTDSKYWIELNETNIYDKFNQPGTFLQTSRGKRDMPTIVKNLVNNSVNSVFVIGGEGSHAGALAISKELAKENIKVSVAAIPKTIDNDIPVIDQSFGHQTSVDVALTAIHNVYSEVQSIDCCLGIVKLMGRDTGHITVNASLAFGRVDVVLIPEMTFELDGPNGLLEHMVHLLTTQKKVVLVVAEGAAKGMKGSVLKDEGKDQSGNTKFGDIGLFLKNSINSYCKAKNDDRLSELNIKYIDPSYMLRATVPNSYDRRMCFDLTTDSVHGMMAGFNNFSTGIVNGKSVYIPLKMICETIRKDVDLNGESFSRVLQMTQQPNFIN
jgi:6-phosphofructokinase 1